jgi:hypothetical protein
MISCLNEVDVAKEIVDAILTPVFWFVIIVCYHKVTVRENKHFQCVTKRSDSGSVARDSVSDASLAAITLDVFNFHIKCILCD